MLSIKFNNIFEQNLIMISSSEKLKMLLENSNSKNVDLSNDEIIDLRSTNKINEVGEKNKNKSELTIDSSKNYFENLLSRENKFLTEINKRIPKDYSGNTLIGCDSKNNKDLIVAIIKGVILSGKKPIIILTASNYKTMSKLLKDSKISLDELYLIDTVSKGIINIHDFDKIIFVDSLRNLTQLQIKLLKILKKDNNVVCIFETIDMLDLYHDEKLILKFTYSIIKLIQKASSSSIFLVNNKNISLKIAQFFTDFFEIEKID